MVAEVESVSGWIWSHSVGIREVAGNDYCHHGERMDDSMSDVSIRSDSQHNTPPEFDHSRLADSVELVPVNSIVTGDSPRLNGAVEEHARALVEVRERLPPIVVHRSTMRVIDGVHRLRAMVIAGADRIPVRFYDGDERDAFVVAVQQNVAHGLPLSLADRRAAAARIVTSHPHWSDRAIAMAAGLSPSTVTAIRAHFGAPSLHPEARVGRDGRVRPADGAEGRRAASRLLTERPEASLREIAKSVGISPATVHDVKERLRRGDDPVPARHHRRGRGGHPPTSVAADSGGPDREAVLRGLSRDPSLRFAESGRSLLRWLVVRASGPEGWRDQVQAIPPHCTYLIASLARGCADEWLEFAKHLEQQATYTA
jgi:ParB-like chromosome segregation protein Spo0J